MDLIEKANNMYKETMAQYDGDFQFNLIKPTTINSDGEFEIHEPVVSKDGITVATSTDGAFVLKEPIVLSNKALKAKQKMVVYRTVVPFATISRLMENPAAFRRYFKKLYKGVALLMKNEYGFYSFDQYVGNVFMTAVRPAATDIFRETPEGYEIRYYSSMANLNDFE